MSLFEEIAEKQLELEKQIKAQGQDALKEYYAKFFEENPNIEAVRWAQYTPYFNDGDPCTFSMTDPEIRFNDGKIKDGYDVDEEDEYGDRYSYGDSPHWFESYSLWEYPNPKPEGWDKMDWKTQQTYRIYDPAYDKLKRLEKDMSLNEKVFEMIFGDHVQITATRDGFQVDEYYHD